ncbi:hypothetical protein [Snodgrassella alvi]|uniref:hypothetical protein n=1 Tax=Snodgrassella alvi TaxID=1196083 RepID=UPI000C1F2F04|nr:hypothetical protein [Snodgrassella alvi]PIT14308.1 hypothetical protein BGI33_07905 [Snodgrassella alvi]PIT17872.1 hypothetical protein BGI34_06325 [Snodgrassella alvi]
MKITLKGKIDENLVKFESDLGYGVAIWGNNKPLLNTSYNIELEIDDFFEWGKNITLEKNHEFSINFINNNMIFKAKVISCEDGGILVLSLGKDIIFIETSDTCVIDSYISFFTTPDNVMLYPIEL